MDMMAYHRSDDITIDLMAATIDMMTGRASPSRETTIISFLWYLHIINNHSIKSLVCQ